MRPEYDLATFPGLCAQNYYTAEARVREQRATVCISLFGRFLTTF